MQIFGFYGKFQNYVAICGLVIVVCISLFGTFASISNSSRRSKTIEGRITNVTEKQTVRDGKTYVVIEGTVVYDVNGKSYELSVVNPMATGSGIAVYYNPSDPSDATTTNDLNYIPSYGCVVLLSIMCIYLRYECSKSESCNQTVGIFSLFSSSSRR